MEYQTELKLTLVYDTDSEPDLVVNALLDLFQVIDTTRLNLTWDNCEWDTNPASEYCKECGVHNPLDEDVWHLDTCPIITDLNYEGEHNV